MHGANMPLSKMTPQWSTYMVRHPSELLLKEAIHINMTPVEERLNRDTETYHAVRGYVCMLVYACMTPWRVKISCHYISTHSDVRTFTYVSTVEVTLNFVSHKQHQLFVTDEDPRGRNVSLKSVFAT